MFTDYKTVTVQLFSFQKEMTKRKMDCELDDIVMEYLKKAKCEKASKIFGTEHSVESDQNTISKSMRKFQ